MAILRDYLLHALSQPLPGVAAQKKMEPRPREGTYMREVWPDFKPAAALLLLYPHDGEWHVLLTVRGAGLRTHTGQVSLPGGRIDPDESVEHAALREAHEEVGVDPSDVELLGRLTPLPIPVSRYLLHPVVGVASQRPVFCCHEHEVDRVLEVPLNRLRQRELVRWEERQRIMEPRVMMDVPYFDVTEEKIWGATAMVLSELIEVLGDVNSEAWRNSETRKNTEA